MTNIKLHVAMTKFMKMHAAYVQIVTIFYVSEPDGKIPKFSQGGRLNNRWRLMIELKDQLYKAVRHVLKAVSNSLHVDASLP